MHGVLLGLAGDERVPVLAACGWASHTDLRAVGDPGPTVGAQVLDDVGGEGVQQDARTTEQPRRAGRGRTSPTAQAL
ncbi:hypothetical protein ACWDBO_18635 [Streptomyces mirabilis]|uniref:hypothetical protein n=1 Tax=Streptomyces mirabilis TaxID=68239 RepID=UPI0029BED66E|nr:hypothetical protein [Streptomyces sp. AK02-04a]